MPSQINSIPLLFYANIVRGERPVMDHASVAQSGAVVAKGEQRLSVFFLAEGGDDVKLTGS